LVFSIAAGISCLAMNPDLDRLQPYPFEKLADLKAGVKPPVGLDPIALSIGEPKHPTPSFISESLAAHLHNLAVYPSTRGIDALRESIAEWLIRRFKLPEASIDPDRHILPLNGTREGLFAFAQAVVDRSRSPAVLMPNPFYQIYEGAAILAGAEPLHLPCTVESGFVPDFEAVDSKTWQRCQVLYICSPGNPTGVLIDQQRLRHLIALAREHDFIIAADECYSELYLDEINPPVGLLQASASMGHTDYGRCVVFHSLSKRSNAPGLRSGFVAGDPDIVERFFRYRTYHGCAMPLQHQHASISAWRDEEHVVSNRRLYREKFAAVLQILDSVLDIPRPQAGFYLWPQTPIPDTDFARNLFATQNVTVLPGRFLSRSHNDLDPGINRLRLALVPPLDECVDAAERIRRFVETL
jgi:N-succinyldiaminopimelate aminotransferase